jgi:hypothetical protein
VENVEKYKDLYIPVERKEGALKRCAGRTYGCGEGVECPSVMLEDGCGSCIAGNDHRDILKEYLNEGGKDVREKTKENNMNISDNILTVFEDSATTAGKIAKRFGGEYGDSTRDLLALKRDKEDLLKIIKDEEEAEKDK